MESQVNLETGVCFYRVDQSAGLSGFLARAIGRDAPVDEWLRFGSIYLDGKRLLTETELQSGQLLRVHTRRKTFGTPDLLPRIAFDHADFLILDKPPGLPTHPTLDNYVENAQQLLQSQLGQKIYVTHRLDIPTSGLLILAKTPEAQSRINKLFLKGYVNKAYRALTAGVLPIGLLTHYIDPSGKVPRPIQSEPAEGWWKCQLEVLASLEARAFFVNQIRLLTGKTHQIRAQLSALGEPVLNDVTYGAPAMPGALGIGLECTQLQFRYGGESFNVVRPRSVAEDFLCLEK